MPKAPYVFKSRDHLVKRLQSDQARKLAKTFFDERISSITNIVTAGVSGNTFRAFKNLPHKPSVIFRELSTNHIKSTILELQRIAGKEEFSEYVHAASQKLCSHWRNVMESEMGYGRAAKLFNLVLKKLACYEQFGDSRKTFIGLLHVPLDSYTIVGLKEIVLYPKIPKKPTMRFIETRKEYIAMQDYIASVAKDAGVPPIYYDILAWDLAH